MLDGKITTNNAKNAARVTTTKNAVCGAITIKDTTHGVLTAYAPYDHNQLYNRETSDQHPIEAITGLRAALDAGSAELGEAREEFNAQLASEADLRQAADKKLAEDLASEAGLRQAADQKLADDLASEKAAREAAIESAIDTSRTYVDDNFVQKVTTNAIVYATNATDGSPRAIPWNTSAVPNTVAVFDDKGCLRTDNPVSGASDYGSQCVNIRYADKTYVKKVTPTTTFDVAYIAKNDGTQSTMLISQGVYQNTLAQRGTDGRLQVGTPVGVNDATTKKYVDDADAKKLNLTGGTITGSLAIQGDLTVTGTTTTEAAQTLAVKDSIIITNADGAELGATLSGIAIRKDGENTYGVMYDPSGDSVKLGLGTLDSENRFTFNDGGTDGKAIATRADSSVLTDGNLVKWDDATKSLIDSGKKTDDFVEKVTNTTTSTKAYIAKTDGSQGTIEVATGVAANTLAQRGADGRLQVGDPKGQYDATTKEYVDSALEKKLDTYTGTAYYPVIPVQRRISASDPSAGYYQAWEQMSVEATNNTVARRTANGTVATAIPKSDKDATPKKYVEDNFVAKVTTGNRNQAYTVDTNNQQVMMHISEDPAAWALARRYTNGRLQVGTPVGVNDATTKAYVDGGFVPKVTVTEGSNLAYIAHFGGGQGTIPVEVIPIRGSLVQRTVDGIVKVGTPVNENDATTKQYVDDGFVAKVTTTSGSNLAYVAKNDGTQGMFAITTAPSGGTIAQRKQNGGALEVGKAVADSDAMPKKQVEDGFVAKTSTTEVVYATDSSGVQKEVPYTAYIVSDSIVLRDSKGHINVANPNSEYHATTKAYVDNLNAITITAGA